MRNKSEKKNSRQSYMIKKYIVSEEKKKQDKDPIVFMVIDDGNIGMHLPYSISNDRIKQLIRENSAVWQPNFKIWKIPKPSFTNIRSEIPRMLPEAEIQDIPLFMERATRPVPEKLKINETNQIIAYDPLDRRIQTKDNPLFQKLYQFQKLSLDLAIRNFGRLIIADEMGIGKTLQSLACAFAFESDWPLLIICPSSLKFVWKDEIKKWIGQRIKSEYVQVVQKYGTVLDYSILRIAIFSYQIAAKSVQSLGKFNIVISDEAHYLKNNTAKRTQALVPFLMSRKRIILLSGTPALAKPRQVFNLIQIVRPDIYYSLKQFGDRYCVLTRNKWTHKMEYDGCRNIAQLHYILKNKIMIRRLKHQVLHELPDKQRQIITLETCKSYVKEIKQLMNSKEIPLQVLRDNQKFAHYGQKSDNLSPLSHCYLLSGLAKIESVKSYITSLLQNDVKILIFAHHKAVMDEIENHLQKNGIQTIRIDGSTHNDTRRKNIKSFQQHNSVRAAILSITAAGSGITLTAASTVIFAQLHWTPANLLQAQDRAHRIGQKSCVNVHYLIGQNTVDHILLKQLEKKLQITGNILNGNKQQLKKEVLERGSMGKFQKSKYEQTQRKTQRSILEYTKKQSNIVSHTHQKYDQSDIDEDELPEEQVQKLIHAEEQQRRQKLKMKLLVENNK